jgi:hypothetical protein
MIGMGQSDSEDGKREEHLEGRERGDEEDNKGG